jgi:uncharacterized protein YnzC (UPF0291/DUF896 family)
MFDNITLKIKDLPKNYTFVENIENIHKSDTNTYKAKIKNMRIFMNLNGIMIYGSLAKYLNNENMTPLNRKGVKQGIKKLEQDIGLSLKKAIVCSIEFGTSIITKEKLFEYLNLFGNTKRLTRAEFSKWSGIETIYYTSKTGAFEFIGYDKTKEMESRKQNIPPLYEKSNVLRLEYKIRKKRGMDAKFKRGLSVYMLFDQNIYKKFQRLFFDFYKNIDKMGQLIYVDKSEKMTPALLEKLQAEQYRQSFLKDFRYSIQQLIEAGKLSPKSLERIRAENNKLGHDIYISEQSTLIKELDAFVYDSVMFGT